MRQTVKQGCEWGSLSDGGKERGEKQRRDWWCGLGVREGLPEVNWIKT